MNLSPSDISALTFLQKVNLYKRLKAEQPDLAKFIDEVALVWPGAKVTYVQVGVEQWGTSCAVNLFPAITSPLFGRDKKTTKGRRK
jgi:hypothetical protein